MTHEELVEALDELHVEVYAAALEGRLTPSAAAAACEAIDYLARAQGSLEREHDPPEFAGVRRAGWVTSAAERAARFRSLVRS